MGAVIKEVIKVFFINFTKRALIRLDESNFEQFGVGKHNFI